MRVALYARVSTGDQSPELQVRALVAEAERRGWPFNLFVEHASGGAGAERPERERLICGALAGEFQAVVIWKWDRWARSTIEGLLKWEQLYRRGVAFISLTEGFDSGTAAGQFQLTMMLAMAEYERKLIRERVKAGIAVAKANGVHCGRAAAAIDWELYAMYRAEGRSYAQAAELLRVDRSTLIRGWRRRRGGGETPAENAA